LKEQAHPRRNRLLTAAQFERLLKIRSGQLREGAFALLALPNDVGHPRLGLIVAKRHVPLAVQRNAVKRLAREAFRRRARRLPGVDALLMVRVRIGPDRQRWRHDIEALWQRLEASEGVRS
jgi:ribonuclease P protein component